MSLEESVSNYRLNNIKNQAKEYLTKYYETIIRLMLSDITLEHVRKYLK